MYVHVRTGRRWTRHEPPDMSRLTSLTDSRGSRTLRLAGIVPAVRRSPDAPKSRVDSDLAGRRRMRRLARGFTFLIRTSNDAENDWRTRRVSKSRGWEELEGRVEFKWLKSACTLDNHVTSLTSSSSRMRKATGAALLWSMKAKNVRRLVILASLIIV